MYRIVCPSLTAMFQISSFLEARRPHRFAHPCAAPLRPAESGLLSLSSDRARPFRSAARAQGGPTGSLGGVSLLSGPRGSVLIQAPSWFSRPSNEKAPTSAKVRAEIHSSCRPIDSRRPSQVGRRQVFWLPGRSPAAPSRVNHTFTQWPVAAFVTGHSGASAADFHGLPFWLPRGTHLRRADPSIVAAAGSSPLSAQIEKSFFPAPQPPRLRPPPPADRPKASASDRRQAWSRRSLTTSRLSDN